MSKHTKGPFLVIGFGIEKRVETLSGRVVAKVTNGFAHGKGQIDQFEQDANARLFSAAPELLEHAKTVLEVVKGYGIASEKGFEELRAAIQKAEGA